jgi:hypothetical protein
MTFADAENKLRAIAGDRYYSLSFEKSRYSSGTPETECRVYVDAKFIAKGVSGTGKTWEEAFINLANEMGTPAIEEDPKVHDIVPVVLAASGR